MTMPTKPTDGSNWSSWGTFLDTFVRGASTIGKALLSATDQASARSAIGAGTSSLTIGTNSTSAKAGDYAPTKSDVGLGNVTNVAQAPLSGTESVVFHDGSTGGGTRPSGAARVRWVGGTSRPTNMTTVDIWEHDA